MDTYCTKCGAAWDVSSIIDDAPAYDLIVRSGMVVECGACAGEDAPEDRPGRAKTAEALHELMPDDPGGVAAMLEDAERVWGMIW